MNFKAYCLGILVLQLAFVSSAFAQTPTATPLTIDQTNVPIRVDGHLSDWPEARMIYLGREDQLTLGKNFWHGEDDFSGRVFITYDQQYLYISAIVQKTQNMTLQTDPSSLQSKGNVVNDNDPISLWNGDCLELFLSVRSNIKGPSHLARGDYHIGFSPGTDCKNPQMYCFNRDETISGARLVARITVKGYLMEGSIPLAYFQGLDLGPGKPLRFDAALDEGGKLSGYRVVRLDFAGKNFDQEDPSTWPQAQWVGQIEQSIPFEQREDLYANLVQDGTRGATYAGVRAPLGIALDEAGKPLVGVLVTTWPKTQQILTDSKGMFQFPKIKVYNKSVFYGRLNGYSVSLAALGPRGKPVTLRLSPLPAAFDPPIDRAGSYFFGQSLSPVSAPQFDSLAPWMKALNPGMLCLNLAAGVALPEGEALLDKFVAFTRQGGVEPMVSLPIDPDDPEVAAQWVHYANVEKGYKIRFWVVGSEPDLGVKGAENYNAYDYVNDFRMIDNAAKREDPSIVVLGPETARKYTKDEDDWITPFLRYDGDIVEGVSIHRYATFQPSNLPVSLREDLRQETALIQALKDKVSQNTDFDLPLLVTGEAASAAPVTTKTKEAAVTMGFWEALWEADKKGAFLNQHLPMDLSTYPWGSSSEGVSFKCLPDYWALKLWGHMAHGRVIPAQIQNAEMSVYATQDLKSKDVTLMIINKGDRYWRPKMLLNGQDAELTVEAGLDQRYDFEIPSYSICRLKLKADRSAGEAEVYTLKMALKGQEPQVSAIKPW